MPSSRQLLRLFALISTAQVVTWCSALFVLSIPALTMAQDASVQGEIDKIKADTARVEAQTALQKARNDSVGETIAPLSKLAGEGKTTLAENAGQMESWLLTSNTLGDASLKIAEALTNGGAGSNIVVLAGDEAIDFTPLFAARQEAAAVSRQLGAALTNAPKCTTPGSPAHATGPVAAHIPVLAAIGAIGSLLQSDTTLMGVKVEATDRLLATELAHVLGARAILPAALTLPPRDGSAFQDELNLIDGVRSRVAAAQTCLVASGRKDPAANQGIALLTAALARHTAMTSALAANTDGKPALLVGILKLDWLAKDNPTLVRVYVDQAGGTVITRKNIWTAFGAPAVGVSGGLVASFNAASPTTGRVLAGGIIACRTRLALLRSVQTIDTASSCRLIGRP